MAGIDYSALFPNSKMVAAAQLGQSRFRSAEATTGVAVSGGGITPTTLNGTPTAVTMSNGNLTATHNSAALGGVNSTSFQTTGKYYFEVIVQTSTSNIDAAGLISTTGSLSTLTSTTDAGIAVVFGSGSSNVTYNGASLGNIGAVVVSDIIGIAVDMTARLAWFRRNNGTWNAGGAASPATGVGGAAFGAGGHAPVVRFINVNNSNAMTANFGASAFSGAVPSGFTAGWPA